MPANKQSIDNLHFLRSAIIVAAGHDASYLTALDPEAQRQLDVLAESTLRNFKPVEIHTLGDAPGWVSAIRNAAKQLRIKCYPMPTLLAFMDLLPQIDVVYILWNGTDGAILEEIVRRAKQYNRPIVNIWPLWTGVTEMFEEEAFE